MVVIRDSDVRPAEEKRDLAPAPSQCAHDSLPFNTHPDNTVLVEGRQRAFLSQFARKPTWLDAAMGWTSSMGHDPLKTLSKRQGGGDVAGGMNLVSNVFSARVSL
jgi:hypothetical protein